jgi:hypothetical protein
VPKSIPDEDVNLIKETLLYQVMQYVKLIEPIVYNHIFDVNEGENVNEWTKKTTCWDSLKVRVSNIEEKYNIPQNICSNTGDMDVEITEGQQKFINEASDIDPSVWLSINRWSKDNPGELTPKEQAFVGQVGFNLKRNWTLTYKQAKWALDIYEKAIDAGWKLDE